jgi:hypothetical protein
VEAPGIRALPANLELESGPLLRIPCPLVSSDSRRYFHQIVFQLFSSAPSVRCGLEKAGEIERSRYTYGSWTFFPHLSLQIHHNIRSRPNIFNDCWRDTCSHWYLTCVRRHLCRLLLRHHVVGMSIDNPDAWPLTVELGLGDQATTIQTADTFLVTNTEVFTGLIIRQALVWARSLQQI